MNETLKQYLGKANYDALRRQYAEDKESQCNAQLAGLPAWDDLSWKQQQGHMNEAEAVLSQFLSMAMPAMQSFVQSIMAMPDTAETLAIKEALQRLVNTMQSAIGVEAMPVAL